MRPLRLELEGFRSHASLTGFDFADRSLFAITGPIGAGKSTILDGISYALYGKTPREQRNKKRLICMRADAARVRLTFAIDDGTYEVLRVLPRKGSGEHVLADLSSGDKTIGDAAVTARIEALLGLDFAGFCASVLLAQNRFARFLEATPGDRGKILKGVFRLDQIDTLRDEAKKREGELTLQLTAFEGELRGIPDDAAERLDAATKIAAIATARATALLDAVPAEQDLLTRIAGAERAAAEASGRREENEKLARTLPRGDDLIELTTAERELTTALEKARLEAAAAAEEADAAAAAYTALVADLGDDATLAGLEARAAELTRGRADAASLADKAAALRAAGEAAATAVADATAAETAAVAALEELQTELDTLVDRHRAHVLLKELRPGEACPVCEQTVTTLPKRKAPAALTTLEKKRDKQAQKLSDSRSVTTAANEQRVRAAAELDACVEEARRAAVRVAEIERLMEEALGGVADPVAEIAARKQQLRSAVALRDDKATAGDRARAALERVLEQQTRLAARTREIAAGLIAAAATLGLEAVRVDAGAEEMSDALTRIADAVIARHKELEEATEKHRHEADDRARELEKLRSELDLEADASIAAAAAQARGAADVAARDIDTLTAQIARRAAILGEIGTLGQRRGLYSQMKDDLTDRNFISYLLEDRTRLLFDIASDRLLEMTSRYRLATDDKGELEVVDELDADRHRNVDTLSGGETFLASLALALALAELVTREGGRLNCFFLDEGFGSLDAESFDAAMDGIERVAIGDRLIGLVSHLPALAARVEDRIELDRDDDGLTVVRSGATRS